jgi:predicted Zn-dependent protease
MGLYIAGERAQDAEALLTRTTEALKSGATHDRVFYGGLLMDLRRYEGALEVYETLAKENPDEPYFLQRMADVHETMGNTARAAELRVKANPGIALVNQPAPEFTGNDASGNALASSSLRGKVVLLNFWASW